MNNTIYAVDYGNSRILVWHENSTNPINTISGSFFQPMSLFVTLNGDIYFDDGKHNGRVRKWIAKTALFANVMTVSSSCFSLFVDTNDTLYCSIFDHHRVVKRSLNDAEISSNILAAGTGFPGSASNELKAPAGIFVDVNFDLYVADWENDRIQFFRSGESNGITVAGRGSPNPTIDLFKPVAIVLDAEKYLFIVDQLNHRIVGSSLNGFRCLFGCSDGGPHSFRLQDPSGLHFDRSGNIFVVDFANYRIQKVQYVEKSCGTSL